MLIIQILKIPQPRMKEAHTNPVLYYPYESANAV